MTLSAYVHDDYESLQEDQSSIVNRNWTSNQYAMHRLQEN